MQFAKDYLQEIRKQNDIVEIVSEFVKLEKKGKNYFGICPFHKEKSPTFSVTREKGIFYCFSCKKGGGIFQFIMLIKSMTFPQAVQYLASKTSFTISKSEATPYTENSNQKNLLYDLNNMAGRFFYSQLAGTSGLTAQQYLQKLELTTKTIKNFGIGYSTDKWNGLYNHLKSKGYTDEVIEASGLVFRSQKENLVDLFRNRIMFPIFNIEKRVVAFCGLSISDRKPLYLYAPDSSIYNRKADLYGINAINSDKCKQLLIFENLIDVLQAYQLGINYSISLNPTQIDKSTTELFSKYNDDIVLAFSSQTLSLEATQVKLDMLHSKYCKVKIYELTNGNSALEMMLRDGEKAIKDIMEKAKKLVDYKMDKLIHKPLNPSINENVTFLNKAVAVLARFGDKLDWEVNSMILAAQYNVTSESLMVEIEKYRKYLKERLISNETNAIKGGFSSGIN